LQGVNIGVLKPSDDSESALDTIDFLNANAGPFSPSTNNASVGDTHAAFGFRYGHTTIPDIVHVNEC